MSIMEKQKIIVILGPTSGGKSDLAVKIARKFNGEIISADSRQVYKNMDIGSGKITKKEMLDVPHYLLGVASPKRTFTVSQYQKLAKKALAKIAKKGRPPIICGGTGLYIDSVIYDYKFPKAPPNQKLRQKLEKLKTEKLFQKLQKLDSLRAKNIDCHNRRRLIRALEIVLTTKKPVPPLISVNQRNNPHESATAAVLKIGIKKSPDELKKKIEKRLYKRLEQKMTEEIKNLHKSGLSWKKLDSFGLEYRFISRYLRGLISRQEMIELILKESYKYAKRQMTWFKRDKNIYWLDPDNKKDLKKIFALCRNFLGL